MHVALLPQSITRATSRPPTTRAALLRGMRDDVSPRERSARRQRRDAHGGGGGGDARRRGAADYRARRRRRTSVFAAPPVSFGAEVAVSVAASKRRCSESAFTFGAEVAAPAGSAVCCAGDIVGRGAAFATASPGPAASFGAEVAPVTSEVRLRRVRHRPCRHPRDRPFRRVRRIRFRSESAGNSGGKRRVNAAFGHVTSVTKNTSYKSRASSTDY